MNSHEVAKWTGAAIGAVLVLVGLIGFIENPIVGEPDWNPIFVAGLPHNLVHIVTGAAALFIAFGLSGARRAMGLMVFGAAYGLVLLATLVSPDLFGIFEYEVNMADHVLHIGLAALPLVVGYWAYSASNDRRTA